MASSSGSSRGSSGASSRRGQPRGSKPRAASSTEKTAPAKGSADQDAPEQREDKPTQATQPTQPTQPTRPARPQPVSFLTVAEVAELMRVSKMTVYRLVHAGDLSAVRVGRSFRVPEEAVHAYLRDAYIEAG